MFCSYFLKKKTTSQQDCDVAKAYQLFRDVFKNQGDGNTNINMECGYFEHNLCEYNNILTQRQS